MLLSGDEIGNSQQGNNNVYCQDNATAWIDWEAADGAFLDFCSRMIELRHQFPVLAQENFLLGKTGDNERVEVAWFQPDGREMDEELWSQAGLRVLGVLVDYSTREVFLDGGRPLFAVLNAGDGLNFALPEGSWVRMLDTARDDPFAEEPIGDGVAAISPASVCLFRPS
jgi:glycogen operon protein